MNHVSRKARVIAVSSGKGGVGKTFITANLAYALVQSGHRVLILDADLGLANLDIMLNLNPVATLHEVMMGEKKFEEVILTGPGGMHILPAASGRNEYTRLTLDLQGMLTDMVSSLASQYDFLFLDTGAGISDVVLHTVSLAGEILVVSTPEPTSLTDAYAAIKILSTVQNRSSFYLIANHVSDESRGNMVYASLRRVAERYLQDELGRPISLVFLGSVLSDSKVERSICSRQLVLASSPQSPASRGLVQIAKTLESASLPETAKPLVTQPQSG